MYGRPAANRAAQAKPDWEPDRSIRPTTGSAQHLGFNVLKVIEVTELLDAFAVGVSMMEIT